MGLGNYNYRQGFVTAPLPGTTLTSHRINTGAADPVRQPPRRVPFHQKPVVEEEVQQMLKEGIIEPSEGPWASPVVLVKKKDGSIRFCIDYRKLNDLTRKDAYPIPRIDDTLDMHSGSKYFSTLDLASGYWQVPVAAEDKEKTAFSTHLGLFQFNRMPFGLCNAPSTFERLMEQVLKGLQWQVCLLYLDDIIIFSKDITEHFHRLISVFERIRQANLRMKPKKCHLFQPEVDYLGHVVSQFGVSTADDKVEKVLQWPTPTTAKEVRQFLGLTSYYRRFVKDYATLARPLHHLTEKGRKFNWTSECATAFNSLRLALTSAPVLAYPCMEQEFILDCDASDFGLGGVLSQVQDGLERVIAYASFALGRAERNYCVTRKELLAVVKMVKHFRAYLYGRRFTLRTDHGSLRWLLNFKDPAGQVARWIEQLAEYDFVIQHRAGRSHGNADAMSRFPCHQCRRETHDTCAAVTTRLSDSPSEGPSIATHGFPEMSEGDLRAAQRKDAQLEKIIGLLEAKTERPTWQTISAEGAIFKALWGNWKNLKLVNGVLYVTWTTHDGRETYDRLVVPQSLQRQLLAFLHNEPTSGHLGFYKTWSRMQPRFYWHLMKDAVKLFLAACVTCARRKTPLQKTRSPLQQYVVGEPLERVALDIIGPLTETTAGNRYILVITDYFTKFTEAIPLPNQEALTVTNALVKEFVCRYGIPSELHSDQGRQFESEVFKGMCAMLGIHKTRTTPYHPQSDGQTERFNRTLEDMLSTCSLDHDQDWDEYVPLVMMAYRSAAHASTGVTPNQAMFGHQIPLPIDLALGLRTGERHDLPSYVLNLQEKLVTVGNYIRTHLHTAATHQKACYDRGKKFSHFNVGDKVLLAVANPKSKLTQKWDGPFTIDQKVSDVVVQLRGPRGRSLVIHVDRLKRYNDPTPRAMCGSQPTVNPTTNPRVRRAPNRYGEWTQ